MPLELDSLLLAISSLEKAIAVANRKQAETAVDVDELDTIKAGVIQNFEFTYELCWKFMKRWLEENVGASYVDGVPRRELFRLAAESLLIIEVERWMDYHKARKQTSHVYDRIVAARVFAEAVAFLPDAKMFLNNLEARNA